MKFRNIIIIIIISILFLFIYAFGSKKNLELYTDFPLLIWKTQINNRKLWIQWEKKYDNSWKNICNKIRNVELIENTSRLYYKYLMLMDCYTYVRGNWWYENNILLIIPEKMSLLFVKPRDNYNGNFIDIVKNNKIIGYTEQYTRELIEIIAMSLKITKEQLIMKKIYPYYKIDNKLFDNENIDVLACFNSLTNQSYYDQYDPTFKIDFVDYEGMDINILKYYLPFVKLDNISLDIYYNAYKSPFPVKTIISIDLLICGPKEIENDIVVRDTLFSILVKADNIDVLNYYTIYFQFFNQTYDLLRNKNNYYQNRDNLTILEQYTSSDYFEISIDYNVEGYYINNEMRLIINNTQIDNIPLQIGWRIIFINQNNPEENGEYFVKIINYERSFAILEKQLIVYNDDFYINLDNELLFNHKLYQIDGVQIKNIKKTDLIYIPHIHKWGNIINTNNQKIKLFDLHTEKNTDDPRWNCTDPNIHLRGLCESSYTIDGFTKKNTQTYWDRRCESNSECPFYQSNKNYPNFKGGCDNGFCQFPIGIKRIAYRLYDINKTKPLCYGCHGTNYGDCCQEQKDRTKYPNLISPDYAYPLDSFERISSGLKL